MKEYDKNMINNYVDTIIVGGGISGTSLASKLKIMNLNYLLIDDHNNPGCINTFNTEDIWCEMGAHTLYNSYLNTIEYLNNNNLEKNIIKREKHPFLFMNEFNNISSIFRNINFYELVISYMTNRKITKDNKTIEQYAEKIFGKKNYLGTLKYCFDAVLSQNSNSFPMNYLFKKYKRDKSYPRTFTINGGLNKLLDININKINDRVILIKKENDIWIIKTQNNEYKCKNICLATGWDIASSLLTNIIPNSASNNYQPKMSKIISIAIVVDKRSLKKLKKISGIIGKEQFFYSAISRDILEHKNLRAITFHCKPTQYSNDILLGRIANILGIKLNEVLSWNFKINKLPMYNIKHNLFLENLEIELKSLAGLYMTGNFFDRVAVENCIKRSNEEIKRLISNIQD